MCGCGCFFFILFFFLFLFLFFFFIVFFFFFFFALSSIRERKARPDDFLADPVFTSECQLSACQEVISQIGFSLLLLLPAVPLVHRQRPCSVLQAGDKGKAGRGGESSVAPCVALGLPHSSAATCPTLCQLLIA